jgi:Spermine/spermidine synthase domain
LNRRYYLGISLISAATLLLELSLTRIISVAHWYHFSFLVISTALLGFGASGVALSVWTALRERANLDRSLSGFSLGFGVTTIGSFWLMQHIPFSPFSLMLDRSQFFYIPLYYLNLCVPFFFSGMVIALLFSRCSKQVNRLYAADLFGAAIGCAAIAVVLSTFGGSGSIAVAAILGFLSAIVFGLGESKRLAVAGGVFVLLALPFVIAGERLIPVVVSPDKIHPLKPQDSEPVYSEWNSFSKTDVYALPAAPDLGRPRAGYSIIEDAGAAGTEIPDLSMGVREYLAHTDDFRSAGSVYLGKQHPKTLIIGSGAGREVLEALSVGASSITAVEINPVISKIVSKSMRREWGRLFQQPEVQLVTEDGRSFVRRSHEKYDAIICVQTMSDAAVLSGALSLSETYILTREAFEDYFDHLTPDGVLLITRPKHQMMKLVTTARALFEQRGLGSAVPHIFVFRGPLLPYGHVSYLNCFLLKKSAWTPAEIEAIEQRMGIDEAHPYSDEIPTLYFSPFETAQQPTPYQRRLYELANAPDLKPVYAATYDLLAPATDDQPFFNARLRWLKLRPSDFVDIFSSGKNASIDYQPIAEVSLVILLVQTIAIAAILILFPLFRFSRRGQRAPHRWSFLIYFASLGLGFIMVEMVLLERFTLFLGQPMYTLAVVLAGLLVSSGAGSYKASHFREASRWSLVPVIIVVLGTIVATALLTPYVFSLALPLSLPWRVVVALALIGPLGFVMGMPFPNGLRIVAEEAPALVPWAWGVNGFFTVIGSVSTVILAMALGFRIVLGVAAACYLVAMGAIILPVVLGLRLHHGGQLGALVHDEKSSGVSVTGD